MNRVFWLLSAILLAGPGHALADQPNFAAGEAACSKLSDYDCWSTKGCVLHCSGKDKDRCSPYACHEAADECESAYAQKNITKDNCQSRAGCVYQPPSCFCPGPMLCTCGGGQPASCKRN